MDTGLELRNNAHIYRSNKCFMLLQVSLNVVTHLLVFIIPLRGTKNQISLIKNGLTLWLNSSAVVCPQLSLRHSAGGA